MRQLTGTLLLSLIFVLCGCTPWATYPPIEGAVDISNPALAPIPRLMADAVRYVHTLEGGEGEIALNLPEGTSATVYDEVIERLEAARPMQAGNTQAYHVEAVRVRGLDAEVDVIHPGAGGVPELMTVYFNQTFAEGWRVKWHRRWRLRIEAPEAHYVPPPPDEEEATGAEEEAEQVPPPPPSEANGRPKSDAVTRPT
ncbi:MAG: hypothetical protein SYC29_16115 [Planctomycetota bacterium]|nr:hypothetical protein [Planctomycetota bacterium]